MGISHQHQVDADEMTKMTKMTKRRGITFKRFSLLAFATLAVASVLLTCVEAIECDPGKEPNGDNCKKCGPGLISDGKSKCKKCKGNEVTRKDHTTCSICEAGKEPSPNKEVCVKCPFGEYTKDGAGSKCTKCKGNKYTGKEHTFCKDCEAGKEPSPNKEVCVKCPSGEFSEKDGSKCTKCKFNYVTGTDHKSCKPCEAGEEPSPNKEVCVKCPAGEFSAGAGSKCTKCRAGTYSEKRGAAACQDCESGITGPNRDKCDDSCQEGYMLKPNGKKCVPIKSCDDGFCLDIQNKCRSLDDTNADVTRNEDGTCCVNCF